MGRVIMYLALVYPLILCTGNVNILLLPLRTIPSFMFYIKYRLVLGLQREHSYELVVGDYRDINLIINHPEERNN